MKTTPTRENDSALQSNGAGSSLKVPRKLIAVMVTAACTAAASSTALAIPESEPNDTFPGQASVVGTTYGGTLCQSSCPDGIPDPIDFYHYSGLPSGSAFDLTGTAGTEPFNFATFTFGLYSDQTTIVDSFSFDVDNITNPSDHLIGLVPLSGELTFGVTSDAFGFEGYSLVLNVTGNQAPEPATLALLAAGLAGGLVARRRKRA